MNVCCGSLSSTAVFFSWALCVAVITKQLCLLIKHFAIFTTVQICSSDKQSRKKAWTQIPFNAQTLKYSLPSWSSAKFAFCHVFIDFLCVTVIFQKKKNMGKNAVKSAVCFTGSLSQFYSINLVVLPQNQLFRTGTVITFSAFVIEKTLVQPVLWFLKTFMLITN